MSNDHRAPHIWAVVHLRDPREIYWGLLHLPIRNGVWLSGVDLNAIEFYLNQPGNDNEPSPPLGSLFFPMHRVEKVSLDEPMGDTPPLHLSLPVRIGVSLADLIPASFYELVTELRHSQITTSQGKDL